MSRQPTRLPAELDADAFSALARAQLHPEPSSLIFDPASGTARGDHDLNPDLATELADAPMRAAAVLVGIVARPTLTVLLTQRTDHLPTHAGQVSFPGGKVEKSDRNPIETALREAEEEIGLVPSVVEPLGFLDSYRTGTGFHIMPVVALVRPEFTLKLDPTEVADAFEVPFEFLMDPANHRRQSRVWKGRERHYYAMPFGERYIWGATAGMLKNMHERLFGSC
ncbi:MAG: CoA pyrophosphatase [Hyphomicrobiaceae bacterium]